MTNNNDAMQLDASASYEPITHLIHRLSGYENWSGSLKEGFLLLWTKLPPERRRVKTPSPYENIYFIIASGNNPREDSVKACCEIWIKRLNKKQDKLNQKNGATETLAPVVKRKAVFNAAIVTEALENQGAEFAKQTSLQQHLSRKLF